MSVIINDKKYNAEYLSTPEEIKKGMMGRDSLDGCMVFKLGMGHHNFWMKGCKIPLDIIYVLKDRISRIHSNCQPSVDGKERFSGIGDHVIEFPAGTANDWKVGDKVNMYLGTPQNPVNTIDDFH
jgi:uncharacterized membrane protein (UPF0127 family)